MKIKYERVVCVNLDRRPENWQRFQAGLPKDFIFGSVERFVAIDGRKCPRPEWWRGGGGAWGCYCSHERIIEECLNSGINSVLIFEDDALFCEGFNEKVRAYHDALPNDAQWIYYGGQHLKRNTHLPQRVNDLVYRPYNINRTHAYGIVGQEAMKVIYKHLHCKNWYSAHHVDHHYGELHQSKKLHVYCPSCWLVDQRGGVSDVAGRTKKQLHWKDACMVNGKPDSPYFVILGCHSSGSSALAGALYHLGVYLGDKLVGMYGTPPIKGGEAIGLRNIYEAAFPVPAIESKMSPEILKSKLETFIDQRRNKAAQIGTVAAGKYPQMALTYDLLSEILQDNLYVIWIDRDIRESVLSLQRRFSKIRPERIETHQRAIYNSSMRAFEELGDRAIKVTYNDLLSSPRAELQRVAAFMGITPNEEQIAKAVAYIDPKQRHIQTAPPLQ